VRVSTCVCVLSCVCVVCVFNTSELGNKIITGGRTHKIITGGITSDSVNTLPSGSLPCK